MTIYNQINQLVQNLIDDFGYVPFADPNDEELPDLVQTIITESAEVLEYNIETIDAGHNCLVLCCSWIEDDHLLQTYNILMES